MSVIIKTHKNSTGDRNVVRLFNNNFSAASQLLRRRDDSQSHAAC